MALAISWSHMSFRASLRCCREMILTIYPFRQARSLFWILQRYARIKLAASKCQIYASEIPRQRELCSSDALGVRLRKRGEQKCTSFVARMQVLPLTFDRSDWFSKIPHSNLRSTTLHLLCSSKRLHVPTEPTVGLDRCINCPWARDHCKTNASSNGL